MTIIYEHDALGGHFQMSVDGVQVHFNTIREYTDERLNFMALLMTGKLKLVPPNTHLHGPNTTIKTYSHEI